MTEPTAEQTNELSNAISNLSAMGANISLDTTSIENFAGSVENATEALNEYMKVERYSSFASAHEGIDDAITSYNSAWKKLNNVGTYYTKGD